MTFKNIKPGLVMMAVFSIWGMSVILLFVISFVMPFFMSEEDYTLMQDYAERFSELNQTETQPEDVENELSGFWNDLGDKFTVIMIVHWTAVALMIYWTAGRIGRMAESSAQAVGYGLMIALGMMMSYGLMCTCLPSMTVGSASLVMIAGMYLMLFVGAGYFGGRSAVPRSSGLFGGASASQAGPYPSYGPQNRGPFAGSTPPFSNSTTTPGSVKPETYYNMGVQAAMGGRREEARQHFTRLLQMQPRNIAAWLQMANLADTPEQAWNYVQQARSINPTDPAVLDAVNVIWPQVAAATAHRDLPRSQPAYPGGQQNDSEIPRVRLPGSALDAAPPAITPPEPAPDQSTPGDIDDADQPPAPPPPPPAGEL